MRPEEAAWVREHVWTQAMRHTYETTPGYFHACACQYGLTHWCQLGQCDRCHRATPLRSAETTICAPGGERPLAFDEPYQHLTDVSATGSRYEKAALVWLADRVCRWVCPCDCHSLTVAERANQSGFLFDVEVV